MHKAAAADRSAQASQQALEWLVILEADTVAAERVREFQTWLAQDPAHPDAWQEARAFWSALDCLPDQDVADILALTGPTSLEADLAGDDAAQDLRQPVSPAAVFAVVGQDVTQSVRQARAGFTSASPVQAGLGGRGACQQATALPAPGQAVSAGGNRAAAPKTSRLPLGLALAASLLLGVGFWLRANPAFYADQYTRVGEQRSITLADGSAVELNTESAISVELTARLRRVTLHGGEAYFQVGADAKRPFEVNTPFGTVRALGTAFSVRNVDDAVEVTQYEHAVSIRLKDGRSLPRLEQGQQVRFGGSGFAAPVTVDLHRVGAWRRHQLVFEDRPLEEVVGEINRYRRGSIALIDGQAARQRVTGSIDIRDPDQALQSLIESLPVGSRRLAGRWVLLYTASSSR